MNGYQLRESIFITLNINGATGSKSTRVVDERLQQFDTAFLIELDGFLMELHRRRIHSVINTFSNALFKLAPRDYEFTIRPFLDHYLRLCDAISPHEPGQWGTLCRGLINGLENYTAHRDRMMTPETTDALLHAAAAMMTSDPKTIDEELEVQHVTHYYSLSEGELLDLIVGNPDAATRFSALLLNGTTRVAELVAATEKETPLSLLEGAL